MFKRNSVSFPVQNNEDCRLQVERRKGRHLSPDYEALIFDHAAAFVSLLAKVDLIKEQLEQRGSKRSSLLPRSNFEMGGK
jgi:hypothetical protein